MPKLPRVTGKEVLVALKRGGFEVIHIKGSHHFLRKPTGGRLVTVPVHSGEIIPPKTLLSILEQTGLNAEEVIRLL